MASLQAYLAVWFTKWRVKRRLKGCRDYRVARAILRPLPYKIPASVRITSANVNGIPGEWVESSNSTDTVLLYLHGGGYFGCSAETHRPVTVWFALHGFRVFAPNYRLAPENPFPAAVDDAVAAYRGLLAEIHPPQRIVVAGDSAGGGLALSLMLALRAAGTLLPAAAALFSPWTDLAATGESLRSNARRCAMFNGEDIGPSARYYLGNADPRNPLASPLYADFSGLPPLLIHVGADECLRDDSTRVAEKARAAGVPVELKIWPVVPHAWQLALQILPEARQSLRESSEFLRKHAAAGSAGSVRLVNMPESPGNNHNSADISVDVLIVGAGFSGICMGVKLLEAGMKSFLIIEKSDDLGGTWYENRYPGCACDVPAHLYSFSFERNPDWTRMFAGQQEIWQYLKSCVERHGLAPYIRFRTRFQEAAWDESSGRWRTSAADNSSHSLTIHARVLVSGMGALHVPHYPEIPGVERFAGPAFHSATWRSDVDLSGKTVAVIGTGASAIQFIPHIAPRAGRLYIFQRTPPWIVPRLDFGFSKKGRERFRRIPALTWAFRKFLFFALEWRVLSFLGDRVVREHMEKIARRHLERSVSDPNLRAALTPRYQIGCKRILLSDDFYPLFKRRNVELVTDRISEVRERSVVTQDGAERPVDVLIYGTGFHVTEQFIGMKLFGRNGLEIHDAWRNGLSAYLGVTVSGFPNFFMLLGPNTGLGHNSVVLMIEAQVKYVINCLKLMRKRNISAMEVRAESQKHFAANLRDHMARTVWQSGGCRSWYQDTHTGENTTLWPGSVIQYFRATRSVSLTEYEFRSVPPAR